MAVLIKGMEMPDKNHLVLVEIDSNGDVFAAYDGGRTKLVQYKAVPVPPHGRLIAEDDAIETAWMILAGLGYCREENPQLEQTVREVYATAPTVEVE